MPASAESFSVGPVLHARGRRTAINTTTARTYSRAFATVRPSRCIVAVTVTPAAHQQGGGLADRRRCQQAPTPWDHRHGPHRADRLDMDHASCTLRGDHSLDCRTPAPKRPPVAVWLPQQGRGGQNRDETRPFESRGEQTQTTHARSSVIEAPVDLRHAAAVYDHNGLATSQGSQAQYASLKDTAIPCPALARGALTRCLLVGSPPSIVLLPAQSLSLSVPCVVISQMNPCPLVVSLWRTHSTLTTLAAAVH